MINGRRWMRMGGIVLVALWAFWVLPPVYHAVMRLCPVRSTGVSEAQAVPNYARRNKLSCAACHTAWPLLNEQGRQFKINGYKLERGEDKGMMKEVDGMVIPKAVSVGLLLKMRPYDKKDSVGKDRQVKHRAFHEYELFLAGNVGNNFSYFAEFEGEDEDDKVEDDQGDDQGEFMPFLAAGQAGWHPKAWGNVMMGFRNFYDMDPYQTITDHGKLTVSHRATDGPFGAVGAWNLGGSQQTTMMYGEVGPEEAFSLYYAAGLTSDVDDNERRTGRGYGKVGNLRLAFDTMKGLMVGGFASAGESGEIVSGTTVSSDALGTRRAKIRMGGVDALIELGGLTARGVFAVATEQDKGTPMAAADKETNRAAYVELMYPIVINKLPVLVPLIRQDWKSSNNGMDHYSTFTAQLGTYFIQNGRAFVEYWAETTDAKITGAQTKEHRWTAQVEIGF